MPLEMIQADEANEEHLRGLADNVRIVVALYNIRDDLPSDYGVQEQRALIAKSALVLLVACWERLVEDLALASYRYLCENAASPKAIPDLLRLRMGRAFGQQDPWLMAGEGWKDQLRRYEEDHVQDWLDNFNTPKSAKVCSLFERVLGLRALSDSWRWQNMAPDQARTKLDQIVSRRGEIAHRVSTAGSVHDYEMRDFVWFIHQLAIKTHNAAQSHLDRCCGSCSWKSYSFASLSS